MKQFQEKLIMLGALLCLLLFPVILTACSGDQITTQDGFVLQLNEDGVSYSVVDYAGIDIDIVIPHAYEDLPVTKIGDCAFDGHSDFKSVMIPDSITEIGSYAFSQCTRLSSVEVPDSVLYIGVETFSECTALSNVTLGSNVVTLPDRVFYECSSLLSITVPDSVQKISSSAFYNCKSLKKAVIGNGVVYIENGAFSYCEALEDVVLGDSVKYIADEVFVDCKSLKSITFPDSVVRIGSQCMYGCQSLMNATFGNGIRHIEREAFYGCDSLDVIYITDVANWCSLTLEGDPLWFEKKLYVNDVLVTELVIPEGVTSIGTGFQYCTNITSVSIPDSVTDIAPNAFRSCENLIYNRYDNGYYLGNSSHPYLALVSVEYTAVSIEIPADTVLICSVSGVLFDDVFYECNYLESICVDSENSAFCSLDGVLYSKDMKMLIQYGSGKADVLFTLPDTVTEIAACAFMSNNNLTSITLGDHVERISEYAFAYCRSLKHISVSDSITDIGESVFHECPDALYNEYSNACYLGNEENPYLLLVKAKDTTISSCEISRSTRLICESAFRGCEVLTSITVPSNVEYIDDYAFYGCALTDVVLEDGAAAEGIGSYAFADCKSLKNVSLGNGVMAIGIGSFSECDSLTAIVIPDSVVCIEDSAFSSCDLLTNITVGNGVTDFGNGVFSANGMSEDYYCTKYETGFYLGNAENPYLVLISVLIDDSTSKTFTIPNTTRVIGSDAFFGNIFTSVVIPDGVTDIGDSSFQECQYLTEITIPSSVTSIGSSAFYFCTSLTSITFKGTVGQWESMDIRIGCFDGTPLAVIHCTDGDIIPSAISPR